VGGVMNLKAFHRNDEVVYTMSLAVLSLNYVGYYSRIMNYHGSLTVHTRLGFEAVSNLLLRFEGFTHYEESMVDFAASIVDIRNSFAFHISCGDSELRVKL